MPAIIKVFAIQKIWENITHVLKERQPTITIPEMTQKLKIAGKGFQQLSPYIRNCIHK